MNKLNNFAINVIQKYVHVLHVYICMKSTFKTYNSKVFIITSNLQRNSVIDESFFFFIIIKK